MNKTIQYILVGAVSLSALSLTSCNKFLDVQPKGTLTEDVQFSTYEGYIDALGSMGRWRHRVSMDQR